MDEYQFEPLQEAVGFFIEHMFNQAMIKGVKVPDPHHFAREAASAKTPETLRMIMLTFYDEYVRLNNTQLLDFL